MKPRNLNAYGNEIEVYDVLGNIVKVGEPVLFYDGGKLSKGVVQRLEILSVWIQAEGREQYNDVSCYHDKVLVLTKDRFPEYHL